MNRGNLFAIAVAVLATACMAASATAAPLYGTTTPGGGSGPSSFYSINPATGAATLIGAIGFNRVGALDAHPTTGVIYAAGQRASGGTPVILTINPITGVGTEVGPHGMQSGAISDLSFRSDGVLFALDATSSDHRLYTINLATGAATLVGSTGLASIGGNALAFDQLDTLWHVASNDVYRVTQTTGAVTNVTMNLGMPDGGDRLAGMDNDPTTGVMYALQKNYSTGVTRLVTVNFTTLVTTSVGTTNNDIDGLAWGLRTEDEHLPVELAAMNISSHESNVLLSWRTASEVDNAGFEVQRSRVDGEFSTIASYMTSPHLKGLGTSSFGKNYSFTDGGDGGLVPGQMYIYRLIDISTDGVRTEHPGLSVRIESNEEAFSPLRMYAIAPNPVRDFAQVSFSLQQPSQVRFELYTSDGRNIGVVGGGDYSAGSHAETLTLDGVESGAYTLVMKAGNGMRVQRLVVVR